MKRIWVILVAIALASCGSGNSDGKAEDEIISLARKRSNAVVVGDIQTLNEILADNFTYVNTSGQLLSRKAYLDSQVKLGNSDSRWISQKMDSVDVRVSDQTAIITFLVHDRFIHEGVEYSNLCRSTFVYERDAKNWRCVMGQTTNVSPGE